MEDTAYFYQKWKEEVMTDYVDMSVDERFEAVAMVEEARQESLLTHRSPREQDKHDLKYLVVSRADIQEDYIAESRRRSYNRGA